MVMNEHATHGNGAVAHPLRAGDEVGCNAQRLGGKGRSQPSESGDDLIEEQQDAVLAGDLAQSLEIALRRRQHAAGAGHRFDDDGYDGRGVDRGEETFQRIRKVDTEFRPSLAERIANCPLAARSRGCKSRAW
jgi:hypothetical protein